MFRPRSLNDETHDIVNCKKYMAPKSTTFGENGRSNIILGIKNVINMTAVMILVIPLIIFKYGSL